MSEARLSANETLIPRSRLDPQRLAWGVVLVSFAIFCVICVVAGVAIYYFLFQSTIPMTTVLQVGRGTIGISDQIERGERALLGGDDLSTDPLAQGTIFVRDPQQAGHSVAAITLRGDTLLTFRRALRPRFDWSSGSYVIELQDFSGEIDILVQKDLGRSFRLTISTRQKALVDIGAPGQYTVVASNSTIRVVNHNGQVALIPPDRGGGRDIPAGGQGIVRLESEGGAEVELLAANLNLLPNSTFQETLTVTGDQGQVQEVMQGWACSNTQADMPRGAYQLEINDGRRVLRLVRGDNATSNGETRCLTYFGQNGLDVSGYTYLEIRATFKINYQSLNACGIFGSECPLMLRMDYIDEGGVERRWFHGFYSLLDLQLNYPLSCNSCRQEHDQINEKTWYTYQTGNLFALLGPDQKPKTIVNVQFYASGHQYDVFVGEVSLLAGQGSGDPAPAGAAPGV